MKEKYMKRLKEHYQEALKYFPEDRIVGIFLYGSQNYGLDTKTSDVDSKLIVLPSLDDIIFNISPCTRVHIMENGEHIEIKDIRLMFQTFRKQNGNFLEILFTEYKIVNPNYKELWNLLLEKKEEIAHYNKYLAVKAMAGMAESNYRTLENFAKDEEKGYDFKKLYNILRIEEYLERYIKGESFSDCLKSQKSEYLKSVKTGCYTLGDARWIAKMNIDKIKEFSNSITLQSGWNTVNQKAEDILNKIQTEIIKSYLRGEL